MLRYFTDTDTDITPSMAKKYDAKLISMPYSIDGVNYYPYTESDDFDFHTFYEQLRAGTLPTTSALNEDTYINYFEPVFAAGDDILYVHFSRAMSASFVSMDKAVETLKAKYPERKFYAIDTKGISIISAAIFNDVGEMLKAGKTPEEIIEWSKTAVDTYAVYFFADDLKFFKHSGRVSGLAAVMGTLIGVRPIIYMNAEGKMVSIGKERGRSKAVARLLSYVEELGNNPAASPIYIANSDSLDIAEELEAMLKEKYGKDIDTRIINVNPTAGSHCGPNAVGVCFRSIHR
ncbi:MAG: DegV family protein [Clostridia bacterium]|nr:DegV family protein [Clostridia bacterium]